MDMFLVTVLGLLTEATTCYERFARQARTIFAHLRARSPRLLPLLRRAASRRGVAAACW